MKTIQNNLLDLETLKDELLFHYPDLNLSVLTEKEIQDRFYQHVSDNSIEITAENLTNNSNEYILISTPDGYQPVGDFYFKKERKIFKLELSNGFICESSGDHLYETLNGWKKAEDLTVKDSVLTVDGFFNVKSCKSNRTETVYDWEVLHENHRYWAGPGISSHNTGKTFLTLNACREAQKMGYNIIYCDSEAAVDEDIIKNFGINPEKFRYQPVSTPHEVRHFVSNMCEQLKKVKEKGTELPKIMLVLDSLGNLATHKERTDAISGSDKKDMTKQQELRSLFRVITTDLAEMKIPFLFTNHTYACALGDTEVIMADNNFKRLDEIKIGDQVITLQGNKEITNIFKYEKTRTLKLTFDNNIIIECSPLHKFLIGEDPSKDSSWITAEELVEGDNVYTV